VISFSIVWPLTPVLALAFFRACLVKVRVGLLVGSLAYAEDSSEGSLFARTASKTEEAGP
jgi:hypothetical protein